MQYLQLFLLLYVYTIIKGDPNSKTANWTVNLLLGVLEQHPSMKDVLVQEAQLFINKHTPLKTT